MIANHWTSESAYYALRRRLPKEPEPPTVPEPVPQPPTQFHYTPRRTALAQWALDHDGVVNAGEAAAEMGITQETVRHTLHKMGAEWIGKGSYRLGDWAPQPEPKKLIGRHVEILRGEYTQVGAVDAHVMADRLGVSQAAIRGALGRMGAICIGPHLYKLPGQPS